MPQALARRLILPTALLLATCQLGGCPPLDPNNPITGETSLRGFASESELLDYFKNQVRERNRNRSFGLFGGLFAAPMANVAEDAAGGTGDQASADDGDFSTTNLQEAGVDESDIFKSDGQYFYIARGRTVRIVQATPIDALQQLAEITVDGPVRELYLHNNHLIVLGNSVEELDVPDIIGNDIAYWPPYVPNAGLIVESFDLTDPASPTSAGKLELDGMLVTSRLTGGKLFIVATVTPDLPDSPSPLAINALTLADVIPNMRVDGEETDLVGWQSYYRPNDPDGYFSTAVITLDAADVENVVGSVAVMGNAGTIYASTEALYVTDADYDADSDFRQITRVHKFDLNDAAGATYVASGSVPGRLLNQFSLGEHNGDLRLATHVDNFRLFWGGGDVIAVDEGVGVATAQDIEPDTPYNALYVLRENAGDLELVGAVENIAPNEDLYAARFLGARAYLVTFERIDPLFVVDLADPTDPQILGELKIPGYSEYLHPVGETHLIGVGRSTGETPWGGIVPKAVQLSLFDVSDPNAPVAVQQLELGGFHSTTGVSQSHKAFTYMADRNLLAMPVRLTADGTSYNSFDGLSLFDGVICFDVDPASGFTERGRLARVTGQQSFEWWYWSDWRRAAVIGDDLYTVSSDGVRAAPLSDLTADESLTLPAD